MSELDDFMNSFHDESDSTMGISIMTCEGQTIPVVANLPTKTLDGDLGGMEPQVQAMVTAQPDDVSNPRLLLNKRCLIDGIQYRIHGVEIGTVAVHFSLIDPNESR